MIILDFGSGSTCGNDIPTIHRMINELANVDTNRKQVVIKWQLFRQETVPYVPALKLWAFREAYEYAKAAGYETTASVFDEWSLKRLLQFEVPFIKLACRPWVYPLLGLHYMLGHRTVISIADPKSREQFRQQWGAETMCCVPLYPATPDIYEARFNSLLSTGISDHTDTWELYHKHKPLLYECHYRLEDSEGPDAAPFARTPEQLREVL